uniref:hypothetical protein n=1 Tax=Dialister sp. TaxID=1955814 RepID=UPI00402708D9
MGVNENAFDLLGVTPEDGIARINDAKDDKSWVDEPNESMYEAARETLTNPRKRLQAEVPWFLKNSNSAFSLMNEVQNCRGTDIRLVVQKIVALDDEYKQALQEESLNDIYTDIIISRKKAGISADIEQADIEEALSQLLEEGAKAAIDTLLRKCSTQEAAQIGNVIAKEMIHPGIGKYPKKYGDCIRFFIDLYNMKVQNELDTRSEKIQQDIEAAKVYTSVAQLSPLFQEIEWFDYLAQPLQLYFEDQGQADKQSQSEDIAGSLRKLSLFYHNERQLTELSIAVTEKAMQVFAENPKVLQQLQEDDEILKQQVQVKPLTDDLEIVFVQVARFVDRKKGKEASNSAQIMSHKDQWVSALHRAASRLEQLSPSEKTAAAGFLAQAYYTLATACTWADMWDYAYIVAKEGLIYARQSGNQEIISEFLSALQYYSKAPSVDNEVRPCSSVEEFERKKAEKRSRESKGCLIKIVIVAVAFIALLLFLGNSDGNTKSHSSPKSKVQTVQPSYSKPKVSEEKKKPKTQNVQPVPAPAAPAEPRSYGNPKIASPTNVFLAFHRMITNRNYRGAYNCLSPDMKDYVGSCDAWASGYRTTVASIPQNVNVIEQTENVAKLSFLLLAVDRVGSSQQKRYFSGTCTMIFYDGGWKIDEVLGDWL